MLVVTLTTLLGLAVVIVALRGDQPMMPRGAAAKLPRWRDLPDPADLARVTFPQAVMGYDPASVDVHFEALVRAYEDLWSVASDATREQARQRAQARSGISFEPDEELEPFEAVAVPEAPELAETDEEALAAEAALAQIEDDNDSRHL